MTFEQWPHSLASVGVADLQNSGPSELQAVTGTEIIVTPMLREGWNRTQSCIFIK